MLKKYKCYILTLLINILLNVIFIFHATANQSNTIHFSFIGDDQSYALMGVQQGIDEANVQGLFLGQQYTLTATPNSSTAIFAAVDAQQISQLSKAYPNKPIFNLTIEDDNLRAECFVNVLHMIPSKAMKKDAEDQWNQKHPGQYVKAQTWHHTFTKYAAGQLNSRFTKSTNQKMTDTAWAGWAAVKLVSDSIARNVINDEASLLQFIKKDLNFDGQKGMSLNFRETGQLRQPLLLIENNKIAGEAPVRGVVNTTNLDSLGLTHCPK